MPKNFVGNYLQHAMDVLLSDGIFYESVCHAYDSDDITVESIKKSHSSPERGNLPRNITPELFYQLVIEGFYQSEDQIKEFARQFYMVLSHDNMIPDVWKEKKESIDGFSKDFNAEIFHTFFLDLLAQDKKARRNHTRLANLDRGKVSLQKNPMRAKKPATDEDRVSTLSFSKRFFTAGARSLTDVSDCTLESELEKLSSVFYSVSDIERRDITVSIAPDSKNLMANIRDYVIEILHSGNSKEVLKIKGPLGSYKNRIMQYLYLSLERKADTFIPIYIDVASYEKAAEGNEGVNEKDFWATFEKDIKTAEKIVSQDSGRIPLLMLDGIRDFNCRNESLYYSINERIQKFGWHLIVCMDTDFTINNQNKYDVHPLVSNNFECYLRIRSMNLNRRQESIEFIRNCISVFNLSLPHNITPEQIYDNLVRIDFLTIDAYWLTYILSSNLNYIVNHKNNISGLYNAICLSFLGSYEMVESASEIAYEFEFGKRNIDSTNPYFDLRWRLIRKHRSMLDFLIAKFYIKKVSELNLENGTREQNIKKLSFFNMVLQKNITRFVVTMLKGIDDYERQIMIIAKKYYDELDLFGKSELTFWMGRLQNTVRKKECVKLLQSYNRKELANYKEDKFSSLYEKRKAAFLIRGISVSLIYEKDKEALQYYLESLLEDKIANSVNRGFHLEYYGDKPYIPNKSLLDFEDDVTKGESTLTVLCLSLDRRIKRNDVNSTVALLEVMTLCNLIQARIQWKNSVTPMDVSVYVDKCIKYLEWIMSHRALKGMKAVCVYFHWIHDELQKFRNRRKDKNSEIVYHRSEVMNTFTGAASIPRTGWIDMGISKPENIVEHMYNCWLVGMLYLPASSETEGYSKNDILQMLLIHDLGETITGDISRPKKMLNREFYEQQEREVMQSLFLSGTYPESVDLSEYLKLWDTWDEGQSINYLIAKDIDNIQTIYQFCTYYLKNPGEFTPEQVDYWLSGLDDIETDIGKDIADILVVNNPACQKILEVSSFDCDE